MEQQSDAYANVSYTALQFSEEYSCSKSSAGQIVAGLNWMSRNFRLPREDCAYYRELCVHITKVCDEICARYDECFTASNENERRVFGFNLNGPENCGKLGRSVMCARINPRLRYKHAQFIQLLNLLYNRLSFIARRDPTTLQHYIDNSVEIPCYEKLRVLCSTFCDYLKDSNSSVFQLWNQFVKNARMLHNIPEQVFSSVQNSYGVNIEHRHSHRPNYSHRHDHDQNYNHRHDNGSGYRRGNNYDISQ